MFIIFFLNLLFSLFNVRKLLIKLLINKFFYQNVNLSVSAKSEFCYITTNYDIPVLVQVWKFAGNSLMHSFSTEHAKQSIFRNIGAGVMQIETCPGNRIFTCGADGTLKMRVLPDRYNIPASIFQIL